MNKGKLIKKEEFWKIFTYIGGIGVAMSFVLVLVTLLIFEKRILRLALIAAAVMELLGSILFTTLERSDLNIYEKGIDIPKAKLEFWNEAWGLPEYDFIPYDEISEIYAKTENSLTESQGVFLEMNDGRELVLMWGSKDKLKRVANELKNTMNEYERS